MAHRLLFDPDDPILARVREIALGMPGAAEKVSHGRPAFFTKKIFCRYGGAQKIEDEWVQHRQALMFLPDARERPALESEDRFWVPAYLGPSGWLGLDLGPDTDFREVAELIEDSFRATALRRLVAELDH